MMQKWNPEFIEICNPSIEYLELYALTAGVILWIHRFKNQRVMVFCDNISVVQMINKSTSSCRNCLVLIRLITLECMIRNMCIYAKYVNSADNGRADVLSRGQLDRFHRLSEGLDIEPFPEMVPAVLQPMEKLWVKKL